MIYVLLVNNAGTTQLVPMADLEAITEDHWDRLLGVNLKRTVLLRPGSRTAPARTPRLHHQRHCHICFPASWQQYSVYGREGRPRHAYAVTGARPPPGRPRKCHRAGLARHALVGQVRAAGSESPSAPPSYPDPADLDDIARAR
jgi:NAD(P)-dependent dehydrogenase (short-subunit alcohol dehydrogenase family)